MMEKQYTKPGTVATIEMSQECLLLFYLPIIGFQLPHSQQIRAETGSLNAWGRELLYRVLSAIDRRRAALF